VTFNQHLDQAQLSTLRMLRNGQLLGGLIRTYRSQTHQQLLEIHSALDAGDTAAIAAIAHSMKSASFSLGATRMGQLSTALESAAMQCDVAQCTGLAMALQESYSSLLPELDREEQS
jgi:HPt (histidine-containing phosphotransfer) domain-containing protein